MGEVMIAHSFKEDGDYDTSSSEVNMAPRFRTLGQKTSKPVVDPLEMSFPLVSQDPKPTHALVLALTAQEESLQRATTISERIKEQSAEIKKSKKNISSLEKQAKLDSKVVEQAKLAFTAAV
ncbi:hypothetical protein Acr_04g0002240 [Actinidia rufa]|uniref:Uncharacterized protein n=1 Tax=Actinidia rufa TaxID=165716 RepID=A0A7J0EH33_9ERIC|nr:hypothetical protein Acr_04g0002240 [Actinidia rufa]